MGRAGQYAALLGSLCVYMCMLHLVKNMGCFAGQSRKAEPRGPSGWSLITAGMLGVCCGAGQQDSVKETVWQRLSPLARRTRLVKGTIKREDLVLAGGDQPLRMDRGHGLWERQQGWV